MNAKELQNALSACVSLRECEAFLESHVHDLRRLFYGAPDGGIDHVQYAMREAFFGFANSACCQEMQRAQTAPPGIVALLILFMSFFERTGLHHVINRIGLVAPTASLRARATAMFKYKYITRESEDYTDRCHTIIELLSQSWRDESSHVRQQCEDMLIEYYCAAAVSETCGQANRESLYRQFTDTKTIARYSILKAPRITAVLSLSQESLGKERDEANLRITEGLYDEAIALLPELRGPPPPPHVCAHTCRDHGGHCHPGLHPAKVAIAHRYPSEFAQTHTYIGQSLNSRIYTSFDSAIECMRYFRQYMPLHMPQIEVAVLATLQNNGLQRRRVHVLDIGGGPGNLYCILAALLYRNMLQNHEFEVSLLEPAKPFHEFLDIIAATVQHPRLHLRAKYDCRLDELPSRLKRADIDWFFVANAITPVIAHARNVPAAVSTFCSVLTHATRRHERAAITIAENTNSVEFPDFCAELGKQGIPVAVSDCSCNAPWLADCQFYVTGPRRLTRPRLRLALATTPEGIPAA